jgi:NAD(P)-dependent dehydrogenase (short-subunit alcohol dehydrogenase family)
VTHGAGAALVFGAGATAGLGGALCRRALRKRMRVIALGRTQAKLHALANELSGAGAKLTPLVCDVTREADVARAFDAAGGPPERIHVGRVIVDGMIEGDTLLSRFPQAKERAGARRHARSRPASAA